MRHTVLDIAETSNGTSACNRNELQAMFAMMAAVRPMHEQAVSKHVASSLEKKSSFSVRRMALWWQRRKQGSSRAALTANLRDNKLTRNEVYKNPQRAAPPLMPHRPLESSKLSALSGRSGRRAPHVQSQQAFFAVLDQMGARHQEARRSNPFEDG